MATLTISQLLLTGGELLPLSVTDTPRFEAEILLAFVLEKPREFLITWPEFEPDESQVDRYLAFLDKRKLGQPIAYLIGKRAFWNLELEISEGVLIPRPDTETLVAHVLENFSMDSLDVADLGTGSGAIALALAEERPGWKLTAIDTSKAALSCCERNIAILGLENVCTVKAEWCKPLADSSMDLIVSNPPYISAADEHLSQGDLRFEPTVALVSGADGLDDIRIIIRQAVRVLRTNGWLMLEHGYSQAAEVQALLVESGFAKVFTLKDLGDNERVTGGCLSS